MAHAQSSPFISFALQALSLLLVGCVSDDRRARVDEPIHGQPHPFVDVSSSRGLNHPTYSGHSDKLHIRESLGQGVCWIDHDLDGDLDLFVPSGATEMRSDYRGAEQLLSPWCFYVNEGDQFIQAAEKVGLAAKAWGVGCAVGDVDGDGYDDLFVTTAASPNRLFHNCGNGKFEDWTERSGVGSELLSTSAAFGDLDHDGDLDLVVATYLIESDARDKACRWKGIPVMCGPKSYQPCDDLLYLNDGTGRFVEADTFRGHPGYGMGVVLLDADGDRDTDVFVANDSSPNHLFLNIGSGKFEESGLLAGVALSSRGSTQAGMGVDAGDLDGDGHPDLIVTNFSDDVHNYYRNDGSAQFYEWSARSGLAQASFTKLGWAVLLEDFDLDGDLDVFVVNGHVYPEASQSDTNTQYRQRMQLLINDGQGNLRDDSSKLGPVFDLPIAGRGASAADVDNDGDLDIVVTRDRESPLLLINNLPACNDAHWLKVRLVGRCSNRQGIGARIELKAQHTRQVRELRRNRGYLSAGPAQLVFGLGNLTRVDELTVFWPSGISQTLTGLSVDREWIIEEDIDSRVECR